MRDIDGARIEAEVMAGLKGFQQRTVKHVFHEMYQREPDPATKFLVADEVGLGKTLVARGLIAKTINHLQRAGTRRIDVIYICSNAAIAAQNIRRLNVTGDRAFERPTRITLLPRQLHELDANGLNFISLTPGTSFNMGDRGGRSDERTVVFRLLEYVLGESLDRPGAYRALRGGQREDRFRNGVHWTPAVAETGAHRLDKGLADAYRRELEAKPELLQRFRRLVERFDPDDFADDWNERQNVVRDLRLTLARSCVEALEPDLVILDEFQRFRELLDDPDPGNPDDIRHLTHHLFSQRDAETDTQARVLLLSATPYKMYTLRDEQEDDHYADFLRTARFLMGPDDTRAFAVELREFRRALMDVGSGDDRALLRRKRQIEARLRRVMVRTERLAVTSDRSGMLADHELPGASLATSDVRAFATVDRVSRHLRTGDVTDFWKSSPYLLNFMNDYKLKRELRGAAADAALVEKVDLSTLLPKAAVEAYEAVDPGNARLRALAAETVGSGAWQLLWMPPALPYYEGRGIWATEAARTLTKRLIFSSWNVVPDAISVLLSYEAERQMMRSRGPDVRNLREERAKLRGLLAIRRNESGPAGMSTFALLYPCVVLAEIADPLAIARDLRAAGSGEPATAEAVLAEARRRIGDALGPITRGAPTEGPEDQRWYALAPLLLDRRQWPRAATVEWLGSRSSALVSPGAADGSDADGDDAGAWAEHVRLALEVVRDGPPARLGRVPSDLADAVAALAVGGPGVCALRSVARVLGRIKGTRPDLAAPASRDAALRIAWGFRTLFNVPEVMTLLRGSATSDDAYWRRTAEEGVSGNLQAVLDEYIHLLPEWLGQLDRDAPVIAQRVAEAVHEAVSVKAVTYIPEEVSVRDGSLAFDPLPMRVRFAVRFGRDGTDDDKVLQRASSVRAAFNSPFWPFVLTSTSVGQEGLDFHIYCHAVVHWNLPANPVDLEQREGRVHRFKGHAIRKNLAARHAEAAFGRRAVDPWHAMFAEASANVRNRDLRDIEPYWVFEGDAKIERQVPLVPLTREVEQLRRLRASLAAYRLVFGQPRQEDLVAYLGDRMPPEELAALAEQLRIDLTPAKP